MSLVSIVHTKNFDIKSLKEAITKSLDFIQFNFERKLKKVVIKPNLCYYYDYSTGETTDPKFVSALIDVFRERLSSDLEIFVVESDASAMRCKYAFKMLGYEKMARQKGVTLVNLSEQKYENIEVRIANNRFRFLIPGIIQESDFLVNVPKIKYQSGVKMTCALKNIYGCNAYPKKYIYHKALNDAIVSINKLIRSNLVIVDGIIVSGIETRRLGVVMASEDPVAIDAAAARILGLNPESVKQITLASKEGIGNTQFILKGESLSYVRDLFPRRKIKNNIRMLLANLYLQYLK